MSLLVAALAAVLAAVHVFVARLRSLTVVPRSVWLSMAGGASVAYVFVHILPELHRRGAVLEEVGNRVLGFLEYHAYLVALLGFAFFYGVEAFARRSQRSTSGDEVAGARTKTSAGVFWVHVGSFAAYNALVGYLLVHREQPGVRSLLFFAAAMAAHFLVNDVGLRDHHHEAYDRYGRWVLAAGVLAGWAVGSVTTVGELAVNSLFAFLAGSVVLNVIKEELPAERESRFWSFAVGAAGYSALLLVG
ncbi:hypothetical protein [Halomicrococcus gelatinilyticus]|uniref:hypothetical protein n=1 Tax=Halomicrococcus gelatinilyticus TaxID=1702103 RepID=UPI002E13FDA1